MLEDTKNKIQIGDYIIIQRQKYTKLFKFSSLDSMAMLGKEQIHLCNIINKNFDTTFKMICQDDDADPKHKRKIHKLDICTDIEMRNIREKLGIEVSGLDNRNIIDDGDSQTLKAEQIIQLKTECDGSSSQILERIVENSKTFHHKTQYSQEKYLKKKEKKYFEYVQIRKPTIRLLTEIYYRQDSEKILGIRNDSLSQILIYSGVCGDGNYLLYESGTNGLLPAAFLNAIGSNTAAKLIHMHPGNVSQRQAITALNFPTEQLNRCISVNIYSVLREYYQNNTGNTMSKDIKEEEDGACPAKKLKLENLSPPSLYKWQIENQISCQIIDEKFDSLIVIAKEHPSNIVKALLPFLKPSRPIVLFSLCKEILIEMYFELKSTSHVTGLHLTSNWYRQIQILPNRTHPEVNMNAISGYILIGYTIR